MRDFFDRYMFSFLFGGICLTFAAHALKHESHPGAALWMIAFVLVIYLRELLRVHIELVEESKRINAFVIERDEFLKRQDVSRDRKDMSFQRDINGITYDAETDTWKRGKN